MKTKPSSGLESRRAAAHLLHEVLTARQPLGEALAASYAEGDLKRLSERDGAMARMIVMTTLRRLPQINAVLKNFLKRKLPRKSGLCREILTITTAQLLFLDVSPHAAVDLGVTLAARDRHARHLKALVNAVLRRIAEQGPAIIARQDAARLNTPDWLWKSWSRAYGENTARAIAAQHLLEAPVDITPLKDPQGWADKLGGELILGESIRLHKPGRIPALPGFKEGAWWVQDAAAALPVRLLGDIKGQHVADLCAAPGGKTAQLIARGARVTAIDLSGRRMRKVKENLARLNMAAELVVGDVLNWRPETRFDAILLDAPCSSTGTIRRHPDVQRLKMPQALQSLTSLQDRLLAHAVNLLKPGGKLVYCVCALQPEEGEERIEAFLTANLDIHRKMIDPQLVPVPNNALTKSGDLRLLPSFAADRGGLDGFFAALLEKGAEQGRNQT